VNTWEQELWDLICALYKMYQGDCKDLPSRPQANALVAFIWGVFSALGAPNLSDPAEELRLVKILNDIDLHLKDPDNNLEPETNQSLIDLVAAIRDATKP
jgi:hypothetical protein